MKGVIKSMKRAPHMFTSKVGMASKSSDPEYDEYDRRLRDIETSGEKLGKDSKAFHDAVNGLLSSGVSFSTSFEAVFRPMGTSESTTEMDSKHPTAANTRVSLADYNRHFVELRDALAPELALIDARVLGPTRELQDMLKKIRKSMTKRDHKLLDFDRHNNALTKLREKKEKSISDEKNLFKLEQDFETASGEYEHYNSLLKTELPLFLAMATRFITPLFHSFYFMQLNVYYLMLTKLQEFAARGQIDLSAGLNESQSAAQAEIGEAIQNFDIVKKGALITHGRPSTNRVTSSTSSHNIAQSSSASAAAPIASSSMPPPPAYTAAHASNPVMASPISTGKRAPPPIPAKIHAPVVQYVTALYDFEPQAAGDLGFKTGDQIEVIERSASAQDWWTGRLNGVQGVFPGNYVQDA